MTSYFQDGVHDVLPPLAATYAAESAGTAPAGFLLARRARVYSS